MESTLETRRRKFESDMDEVLQSWLAHGDPIPERWKPKTNPKDPMPFSELQELGIKGCSDLVLRARHTFLRFKALSDSLGALSYAIYVKSLIALDNLVSVMNMASLVNLPNELLSRIFDFVVNGDQSLTIPARQKAAVILSHVCRYFRNTALSCAQLWSNIGGSREMAALCLSRSQNAPLDVKLTIGSISRGYSEPYDFLPDVILEDAVHHISRWKSLEIQLMSVRAEAIDLGRDFVKGSEIRRAFRGFDAPSLKSLSVRGERLPYRYWNEVFAELESWNAPGIRHITSSHYFPLRFPGLVNVADLNLKLDLDGINLTDVLNDLSKMTALKDLELTLDGGSNFRNLPLQEERTDMRGVERLHINVPFTKEHESDPRSSLKKFFSSLLFPGVVDLQINLTGDLKKSYPEADAAENSLIEVMIYIFQHTEQFPSVEWFYLKVIGDDGSPLNARPDQIGRISLVVPLGLLPSLKHLKIFSNFKLLFFGDSGPGDDFFKQNPQFSWESWLPGAPGMALPALEIISINIVDDRRWCQVISLAAKIMQEQKERGDWGRSSKLIVLDSTKKGGGRTSVYKGKAALEWCKDK
ncbi:hypothetical protein SCHPADRAFT_927269 [Schizopora paradoxa]|uniref:Uncharacterized protein n=1 Tax=Schizopora paradoxa TaxID=27342 RepID=A0A0H2SE68_9AGAM|nr:hypothetical protein SCHPADRAFT_927269 [Schizopora paradoxa]